MKKLLSIFLCLGIIVSCTREMVVAPEVEDDNATLGCLNVFIENPAVATRSVWAYDDWFPDGDIFSNDGKQERWLHNLSLAYFDDDMLLEYFGTSVDHTAMQRGADIYSGYTAADNKEYSVFTLGITPFFLTTGSHYFYIFCNVPPDFLYEMQEAYKDRVGKLTKDEFESIVLGFSVEDVAAPFYTQDMRSQPRCMMTNITSPEPYYMADKSFIVGGGSYPEMNRISMEIGKAFAKVSLAYIKSEAGDLLSDIQYRILNDPKKMYMLSNIFGGQVYTPHYDKDPGNDFDSYFAEYFNENSGISKVDDPSNEYFQWRNASEPDDRDPTDDEVTDYKKTHAYCLENGNKTPLQGNSTMVLVKARYNPEKWLNPDGTQGTPSLDNTFWRVRNSGGYLSGYYNAKPDVAGSYTTVEYPQGITYYPIWIQTDGKYMVKRNHYYKIAITEVLSAGAATLEEVMTPEAELETDGTGTRSITSGSRLPEAATSIRWEQNN